MAASVLSPTRDAKFIPSGQLGTKLTDSLIPSKVRLLAPPLRGERRNPMTLRLNPHISQVRCSRRGTDHPIGDKPLGLCTCCAPRMPLVIEYAPEALRTGFSRLQSRAPALDSSMTSIARYEFALPVQGAGEHFYQGVGFTPCYLEPDLSRELDVEVFVKCEALNPSGSFKDRGLSVAVLLGAALGAKRFCLPTQGNAGVAAALFSSRAGFEACRVWMPLSHKGGSYQRRAEYFGAEVTYFGAHLGEAGRRMREAHAKELEDGELVDVSTFFEPGRLEGKKTLGLEIAEQLPDRLPDAILYPTGGGTGLVGIWKAFLELQKAEVLSPTARLPKMIAVQAEGCAPIVQAFTAHHTEVTPVTSRGTRADGLNVPAAIMGHRILDSIAASNGLAVTVSDTEMEVEQRRLAHRGIPSGFEGAATLAALRALLASRQLAAGSRVLLLLTSGPSLEPAPGA